LNSGLGDRLEARVIPMSIALVFVGQQQTRAFEGFDRLCNLLPFGFGVFAAESAGGALFDSLG